VIDPEAADPEDELVIDPEAADPVEASTKMRSMLHDEPVKEVDTIIRGQRKMLEPKKKTTLEEMAPDATISDKWVEKRKNKRISLIDPGLEVVVGSWWDSKGSFYEVSFAETKAAKKSDHEAAALSVLTTRPTGEVRWTSGLIKLVRNGWYEPADICWGDGRSQNHYVVELPLESWDNLRWLPSRGRGTKAFEWTRYKEEAADTASPSPRDQAKHQWQSHRSANIRHVQARSGAWRVIDKEPIYE